METKTHDHLVTVDVEKQKIRIFRVMPSGEKVLFTEYALPDEVRAGWTDKVEELSGVLGEDIFMDSVALRDLLGL